MKFNLRSLFTSLAAISLLISGCSAGEPPAFSITQPGNGSVFPSHLPVNVTLSARFNADTYTSIRWEIFDNQTSVAHSTAEINEREIHWAINNPVDGVHHMTARGQAYSSASHQSAWLETTDVCFWVGDNAPADFCSIGVIVQPISAGSPTPEITPMNIIRPSSNNTGGNNGGSSDSSGGAASTGCEQYGDVTSCNSAGCSWSGSSCIVTP